MHIARGVGVIGVGGVHYYAMRVSFEGIHWQRTGQMYSDPMVISEGVVVMSRLCPNTPWGGGTISQLLIVNLWTGAESEIAKSERSDLVPISVDNNVLHYRQVEYDLVRELQAELNLD